MLMKTMIFPQIPLLFLINLMNIFPMLQKLQEAKFLILRNISLSFLKIAMIKHFLFHPLMKLKLSHV